MAKRVMGRTASILRRIPKDQPFRLVEVGVFLGANALGLLRSRPLLEMVLVDTWGVDAIEGYPDKRKVAWAPVWQRLWRKLYPYRNRIVVIPKPSVIAHDLIVGDFDGGFIDADHRYEPCALDI